MFKKIATLFLGVLPASKVKNWALTRAGHDVHPTASIGPNLIWGSLIVVGQGARIGSFNVLRGLVHVRIGQFAEVGQWNWLSAAPFLVASSQAPTAGTLSLGEHSSLTSRHYLDASGGITIGRFATVAGVRSVFMTHGINVADNVLDTAPIEIGEYAMIGSSTNFVLGSRVPDHSIVAMGSVVVGTLTETFALYAGAPAKFKKNLEPGRYSQRSIGMVPTRNEHELREASRSAESPTHRDR